MASLRTVRRKFRRELRKELGANDGSILSEVANKIARDLFGREAGFDDLLKAFYNGEVNNAMAQLRKEGVAESVGRQWKTLESLQDEDLTVISMRRFKRLRGECKAEVALCHEHGRVEEAVLASRLLSELDRWLEQQEAPVEAEVC